MQVSQRFIRPVWLLPLALCGLALATQMFSVEHPGFRVAARALESVITPEPATDTPEPPRNTPQPPPDTPVPPTDAPAPTCTATAPPPTVTPAQTLPRQTRTPTSTPTPAATSAPPPPTPDAAESNAAEGRQYTAPLATATPLPPGIKYVVRAERAVPGPEPAWLVHVCVFDTTPGARATPPATNTRPTPAASPTPANLRIVATNIRVAAHVQEPARILGGWSESSRAELTTRELSFYTPVLRESEVLRYALMIETSSPATVWRVRVSDARGPAIDLSGDPTIQCDSSGLFITFPEASAGARSTPAPTPSETIAQVVAMAFSDRATALRAGAPSRGPAFSADHTQTIIVIITGSAGLACLIAAIFLWRRQQRNRGQIAR